MPWRRTAPGPRPCRWRPARPPPAPVRRGPRHTPGGPGVPGPLGATRATSTPSGGCDVAVADVEAVAKNSASPGTRFGSMASAYTLRWAGSGTSTMIRSASSQASYGVSTRRPCASALARLLLFSGRPTRTSTPESRSDRRGRDPDCRSRGRRRCAPGSATGRRRSRRTSVRARRSPSWSGGRVKVGASGRRP